MFEEFPYTIITVNKAFNVVFQLASGNYDLKVLDLVEADQVLEAIIKFCDYWRNVIDEELY